MVTASSSWSVIGVMTSFLEREDGAIMESEGELLECRVEQHGLISEMNFKSWLILFICPALSLMSPNGSIQHGSKDYDGGINAVATQSPTSIQKVIKLIMCSTFIF